MSTELLHASLLPPFMAVAVMALSAVTAFAMANRARKRGPGVGKRWQAAAAVALGSGIWCMQLLGLQRAFEDAAVPIQPGTGVLALVVAIGLCLAALKWAAGPLPLAPRVVAVAGTLGLAGTATQALLLSALGLASGNQWQLAPLALALVIAGGGLTLALQWAGSARSRPHLWQAAAAAVVCASMWACHVAIVAAASVPRAPIAADTDGFVLHTLAMTALVACSEMMLVMLLFSAFEGRAAHAQHGVHAQEGSHLPQHDDLTGLPNRRLFEGRLAQALQQAETRQHEVVVLLVALDSFRHVNEEFGHQQGDEVLRRAAQTLRALVPAHCAARLGGDEFLLLVDGEAASRRATELAAQALHAVAVPCSLNGREHSIACSIGLAVYPRHGAQSALLAHAHIAMRAAKAAGGASHAVFDPSMVNSTRERAELLSDLRLALARGQLELYYQPKIHAPSGQIMGVEALLRWHHPKRGIVSPELFIPMAERHGLINALGDWVIDQACQQARCWRDEGLRMRVAINVSAHQLSHPGFSRRIDAALKRHRINPALLTCEITESVAMEDTEATSRVFAEVAALGVHLSIDDFGSGYSSLGYLRKLPAEELKIDRSFVLDLEHSPEAREIAKAVVNLAQSLNMTVVAEGVETEAQQRILAELGCDQLQGYLFAKPMSAKALTLWALSDEGPRSMQFRESLFRETQAIAL